MRYIIFYLFLYLYIDLEKCGMLRCAVCNGIPLANSSQKSTYRILLNAV
jgi:hypothetical protein